MDLPIGTKVRCIWDHGKSGLLYGGDMLYAGSGWLTTDFSSTYRPTIFQAGLFNYVVPLEYITQDFELLRPDWHNDVDRVELDKKIIAEAYRDRYTLSDFVPMLIRDQPPPSRLYNRYLDFRRRWGLYMI